MLYELFPGQSKYEDTYFLRVIYECLRAYSSDRLKTILKILHSLILRNRVQTQINIYIFKQKLCLSIYYLSHRLSTQQ